MEQDANVLSEDWEEELKEGQGTPHDADDIQGASLRDNLGCGVPYKETPFMTPADTIQLHQHHVILR